MIASIVTLLVTLAPFLVWLWKRHEQRKDNPYAQHQKAREELAREIIQHDETAANRNLDNDLDRLRTLQSHQQRPDNLSTSGG
jgi:hypothetical protein